MPKLGQHFVEEMINPSMYASQWFITVFTYSFPFHLTLRVWDVFLYEVRILSCHMCISCLDCILVYLTFLQALLLHKQYTLLYLYNSFHQETPLVYIKSFDLRCTTSVHKRIQFQVQSWLTCLKFDQIYR